MDERNQVYADSTVTVPKGVLYPLCSMNVAFQRELMGPAFMQGLMGVGQPWSRYDDMWAGWASKTVADHIGVGCKSGAPYIKHDKASNPFVNLMKEYKGLEWQEETVRFFDTVQLSAASSTDAGSAFKELADRVEESLGHLNPYFARLAEAMRVWVDVWRETQAGSVTFQPSRRSSGGGGGGGGGGGRTDGRFLRWPLPRQRRPHQRRSRHQAPARPGFAGSWMLPRRRWRPRLVSSRHLAQ